MRFSSAIPAFLLAITAPVQAWNRLDKDNAALLVIDHQVGLSQVVRDFSTNDFRNNMLGHAALGNIFDLPTVLTTSSDGGPNGLMVKEIMEMHPNATFVRRQGEVNAWDNAEFRAAVRATGKKQLIIGGIVTEVCTAFLALSLIDEGYEVYANTDASGTFDTRLAEDANRRMERAGVTLMGIPPGLNELLPFLDKYQFAYGLAARHHAGALQNGTLAAVELGLI
ncbi:hypothetical protein N7533_010199 [Penicillium manginii]|uniref:uncharacterized protein n=1 Tax=Penicillium manginii TaxID=203109 RepID=UPI0025489F60|nr:uncharacterized protein N7533_010199 [Penicillium manginii]KAJ5743097.1 hypothetical protein N7533_010199 [Penicillium manginii]